MNLKENKLHMLNDIIVSNSIGDPKDLYDAISDGEKDTIEMDSSEQEKLESSPNSMKKRVMKDESKK
jgi:hypothetical protein